MTVAVGQKDETLQHVSALSDYDLAAIRADFPILGRQVHGQPLVYLDSAASAQKPRQVIAAESAVYEQSYANVHRGVHALSAEATDLYEAAREKVRAHLNAASTREVIFTRGATEAINLVAHSFAGRFQPGDEIVISALEHHSNIVPWQLVAEQRGLTLRVAPISDDGAFLMDAFLALLNERTKLVAVTQISNAIGTIVPVDQVVAAARARGIATLIDGAQGAVHRPVDVQALGCDFYVFSGHKIYGPSGIGALYGREALLDSMPPWQGGGEMIRTVSFERSSWADLPYKFEAGTPAIAQAVGLGAALDYVRAIGLERIARHEADLLTYGAQRLLEIEGLRIIGATPDKASIISFAFDDIHPHDIGTIVDRRGVAVRAGHHCAQPLMQRLDLPATARASFGLYNSRAEIDRLADALLDVKRLFG